MGIKIFKTLGYNGTSMSTGFLMNIAIGEHKSELYYTTRKYKVLAPQYCLLNIIIILWYVHTSRNSIDFSLPSLTFISLANIVSEWVAHMLPIVSDCSSNPMSNNNNIIDELNFHGKFCSFLL